jgi:ferritin-like protein
VDSALLVPKQIKTCASSTLASNLREKRVPSEIFDVEKFVAMSANAEYCSVKRLKGVVKLKLRMPSKLYTLKVESLKAEETIKKLKCKIQEI